MEFKQRFMRAVYMAMEGMPHFLMHLPEGIEVIGAQYDVSDEEVLTIVHILKASIDRKEYVYLSEHKREYGGCIICAWHVLHSRKRINFKLLPSMNLRI